MCVCLTEKVYVVARFAEGDEAAKGRWRQGLSAVMSEMRQWPHHLSCHVSKKPQPGPASHPSSCTRHHSRAPPGIPPQHAAPPPAATHMMLAFSMVHTMTPVVWVSAAWLWLPP